jgi:hypothetical protein
MSSSQRRGSGSSSTHRRSSGGIAFRSARAIGIHKRAQPSRQVRERLESRFDELLGRRERREGPGGYREVGQRANRPGAVPVDESDWDPAALDGVPRAEVPGPVSRYLRMVLPVLARGRQAAPSCPVVPQLWTAAADERRWAS